MKTRLLLSFLALLFGVGIITVSMVASISNTLANNSSTSAKEMYLGEVLPDHLGYPVVAAIDRFYLETSNPTERVHFEIKYSHRRLYYAKTLLQDDQTKKNLALSTLTKSQKYLLQAFHDVQENDVPDSTVELLIRALAFNIKEVESLTHQFPDNQRTVLDDLRQQQQIALDTLRN